MLDDIQRKKLSHFFNILDNNRNGILQEDDFTSISENACNIVGIRPGTEAYDGLIKRSQRIHQLYLKGMGKKLGETISKEEWMSYFENIVLEEEQFDVLKEHIMITTKYVFDLFDQDKDGFISLDEYIDMFTIYHIDVKFSAKSFIRLDSNRDEQLSKLELYNAVTDFFISTDEESPGNWIFGNWNY